MKTSPSQPLQLKYKILAPNLNRFAMIVPLGHRSGTGKKWYAYLSLSRKYLVFILLLTIFADGCLVLSTVTLLSNAPLEQFSFSFIEVMAYGFLLALTIFTGRVTLDIIRLVYFLQTGRYIAVDKAGNDNLQQAM